MILKWDKCLAILNILPFFIIVKLCGIIMGNIISNDSGLVPFDFLIQETLNLDWEFLFKKSFMRFQKVGLPNDAPDLAGIWVSNINAFVLVEGNWHPVFKDFYLHRGDVVSRAIDEPFSTGFAESVCVVIEIWLGH